MQKEHLIVNSNIDGTPIGVIKVQPEGEIKAVVQISHGMCEHKERYLPFMEYLANHGFASIIHDHRGHGESVREKCDLGYMYKNGAEAIVEDVNQINRMAKEAFPNVPFYLLGHSMGSLIARTYVKRNDGVIDGLIVCGSPSNNKMVSMALLWAKLGGFLRGDKTKAQKITDTMFKHHNDPFVQENSPNAWVCSNRETVEKYDQSEYCGFTFTYNGVENLFKLVKKVYSKRGWCLNNPDMPIWFISGEDDPCLISEQKFHEAVEHMKKVGYKNVSSKLYKGMRHEILNETEKEQVYSDVVAQLEVWVDRYKSK